MGPIRRVRFTRAALRQANIRENRGPSFGKIQVKSSHQRSPHALQFDDRSQEETARQERCARGDAWKLAKNISKLREKDKATFHSPAEEWILPAASTKKTRGKRDCGRFRSKYAHGQQERINSAEMETVRMSKNPTTVVNGNSEVLTEEETTVNGKELNSFVTVMLLEDTSAVLSLGKLCEGHGYTCHWTSGQKPHLIKNGGKSIATQRTTYHSLSLNYRQVLLLHPHPLLPHLHRRRLGDCVRVWRYREICRMNQQKPKTTKK